MLFKGGIYHKQQNDSLKPGIPGRHLGVGDFIATCYNLCVSEHFIVPFRADNLLLAIVRLFTE